jgi:membrane fusion protein (multidrug efflux system)
MATVEGGMMTDSSRAFFLGPGRMGQVVVLSLALALTAGCGKSPEPQQLQATAAPPPPPVVEVTGVVQRTVPIYEEWVGTLDGRINAQILAQVTGYLVEQTYKEGDYVRKGQLLYRIDPRTFQAALDEAKGNLARQQAVLQTARLDLDRIQRLLPQNAVSVRDRDNAVGRNAAAEAEVLVAKAAVEKAQLQLEFTRIVSPIDGIAGRSKAQLGDLVGPGSANATLTTISDVDPIKANLPLSEQRFMQFARDERNGTERRGPPPIELILSDGKIFPQRGKVYFTDRQVDVKTGTILVTVLFPNPGNFLRPGQFARLRAPVALRTNALLVPQRAVGDLQGRAFVAVVMPENTVNIRMVTTAETVDSLRVISQGLNPGERVIVEGLQRAREGMKVDPRPFVAPAAAADAPGQAR